MGQVTPPPRQTPRPPPTPAVLTMADVSHIQSLSQRRLLGSMLTRLSAARNHQR
jgi:hypothetical protein